MTLHASCRLPILVLLASLVTGCSDKAKPEFAECVKLEAAGDLLAAWQACESAISADPNSESGKAAATKLKEMRERYDALKKVEEERQEEAKREAEARLEAERKAAAFAQEARARVNAHLRYEGATASGSTIVLRSDQCDQLGATVMGRALRQKIGDADLVATGLNHFECHHPAGAVYEIKYKLAPPPAPKPSSRDVKSPAPTAAFDSLDLSVSNPGSSRMTNDCFDIRIPDGFRFDSDTTRSLIREGVASGAAFSDSNDALMTVVCHGPTNMSLDEFYQVQLTVTAEDQRAKITYKTKMPDAFVISGYILDGEGIIYKRVTKAGPAYVEVQVGFATAHRLLYERRLNGITKGVTPGKGVLQLEKAP